MAKPVNHFFEFADNAEVPLRRIHSELFACCEMMKHRGEIDEEVTRALAELNSTALERVEALIADHDRAYRAARGEVAA